MMDGLSLITYDVLSMNNDPLGMILHAHVDAALNQLIQRGFMSNG